MAQALGAVSLSPLVMPAVAVAAGVISFSSPCCLPLMPGYLSFVSGLPVTDLGKREARMVTLRGALHFVAGFTLVFTVLGAGMGLVGTLLFRNLALFEKVAGAVIIVMGLATMGLLRIPVLYREARLDLARVSGGPWTGFPLGMAFAFGWAPCIGPVLATILTTAAATQTVWWGAILLVLYSLGLGIPFVLIALGFQRARGALEWLRRNGRRVEITGGALLVAVGVMFVSGSWRALFIPLQRQLSRLGWPPF